LSIATEFYCLGKKNKDFQQICQYIEHRYIGTLIAIISGTMKLNLRSRQRAFTLVEIMIVVAIIALLAAIAVPGFLRARKRSQASRILNDLRMIDSAVDQYAIETNRTSGATVSVTDWTNYLKKGSLLYNSGKSLLGTDYGPQAVDTIPLVPSTDYTTLSDVAGVGFWSPYGP
jgi:prepilin-type N-terminal cleavage/methylation domain-containing protein